MLGAARRAGHLGPGPVAEQATHALAFAALLPASGSVVDLGSGGGIPALPVALAVPGLRWALVETRRSRVEFLREAVADLRLGDRVEVVDVRAEELAHDPRWRGQADAVTSRSFGPPAVTAEVAAGLLRTGGVAVVSLPPGGGGPWPAEALEWIGLTIERQTQRPALLRLRATGEIRDGVPRRWPAMTRRPLFHVEHQA